MTFRTPPCSSHPSSYCFHLYPLPSLLPPPTRYHTSNSVCALARVRQEKQEEKLQRKLLAQQDRENRKNKSGEAEASAPPSAGATLAETTPTEPAPTGTAPAELASAKAASEEPNADGGGKKRSRRAAAAAASNKIGRDARDNAGGGKGNPDDDDMFEPVDLSDDSSDGEGGTGKIGSLSWMAGRNPKVGG